MTEFVFTSPIPVSAADLADWHFRPGAFERLTAPWQRVALLSQDLPIVDGSRAVLELRQGPFRRRWVARHEDVRPGESFVDVQESGPFAAWRHRHRFVAAKPGSSGSGSGSGLAEFGSSGVEVGSRLSSLVDEIIYRLPAEPLSRWMAGGIARREIARLFRHRHAVTRRDLERHALHHAHGSLRIAISGGTGLIGSALAAYLATAGHEIHLLTRSGASVAGARWAGRIGWSVRGGTIEREKLEGLDAVIHLAGAPIATRWTESKKREIEESRVRGTTFLAETLAGLEHPPRVFVSASAVGWYGRVVDDRVREEGDPAGPGFLGAVATRWEAAADAARACGIRTVHPRLGVVVSARGGALAKMLPAFGAGVGGPIGSGRQWFPWISLEDVLGAIEHLLFTPVSGPVNLTAPEAVRQAEFARALGRVLRRPAVAPLPAAIVRMLFGEMGEEALLAGVPVAPRALLASGFVFQQGALEGAFRDELGLWD